MREEAITGARVGGGGAKKRRKRCARWCGYRWRGGGTRQGNGNARRTEYRVGWSSEVARVRGKGFARETYKWHACLDTPFRSSFPSTVYPSRSPALCKHCTIPFEPASIPKCALVKHVRGAVDLLLRGRDPPLARRTQRTYARRRAKFRVKILGNISKTTFCFPEKPVVFQILSFQESSPLSLSLSFASANVNIRSREGMHDLSAVPV